MPASYRDNLSHKKERYFHNHINAVMNDIKIKRKYRVFLEKSYENRFYSAGLSELDLTIVQLDQTARELEEHALILASMDERIHL